MAVTSSWLAIVMDENIEKPTIAQSNTAAMASNDRRDGPSTPLSPSLETLPFEMQRLILSYAPDFDTLCNLVHASPQLHRVYVADRLNILRGFVQQLLEGILFDAHAAYVSEQDHFQLTRTVTRLWEFLKDYQRRRSIDTESALAAQLSLEDAIGLIHFHQSIIEPLTERYAGWALEGLPVATQEERPRFCPFVDRDMWNSLPAAVKYVLTHRAGITSPVTSPVYTQARDQPRPSHPSKERPLSDMERRRIQRGMYRWELFCNVVGDKGGGRSSSHYIGGPHSVAVQDDYVEQLYILALFPAWQVEEMLSIYEFMNDMYSGIFAQRRGALGSGGLLIELQDLGGPYVDPHYPRECKYIYHLPSAPLVVQSGIPYIDTREFSNQ
jgi:hypothetical protein